MSTGRSPNAEKLGFGGIKGKVAIISGASRGIGRECALALAREGCHIVVAAKTTEENPKLPGTIFSVASEVEALGTGAQALPCKVDVLNEESIKAAVAKAVETFGRIDIVINNASALWWQPIDATPMNKYDLITRLNARGSFMLTKYCLPEMAKNKWGRVINMSPPISNDYKMFKGMTAYNISKMGMSMVALGAAAEYEGQGVTGNCLWPATVVESQASINFELGDRKIWRKATVIADATVAIICDPGNPTGNMFIDDTYLKSRGLTDDDLVCYRYDPSFEPPRALAEAYEREDVMGGFAIRRGDVRRLEGDKTGDRLEGKHPTSKL